MMRSYLSQPGGMKTLSKTDTKNGLDNRGHYTREDRIRIERGNTKEYTGEYRKSTGEYRNFRNFNINLGWSRGNPAEILSTGGVSLIPELLHRTLAMEEEHN